MNKYITLVFILVSLLVSCGIGASTKISNDHSRIGERVPTEPFYVRPRLSKLPQYIKTEDKTIFYKDDTKRIEVEGKAYGLPDDTKRIYLTLFTDYSGYTGEIYFQRELGNLVREYMESKGLQVVNRIKYSHAIVEGSILKYSVTRADDVTNADGLLYTLQLQFRVNSTSKKENNPFKNIEHNIIVLDTNTYLSNYVDGLLITNLARKTSEAIYYGWQLEYSGFQGNTEILGGFDATNNTTNR